MELAFVIPGHYRNRNSAEIGTDNSSSTDFIRVLGEDPNKDDFFLVHDGAQNKSLHESQILANYVYINTVASPKDKTVSAPNHLFSDFKKVESNETNDSQQKQSNSEHSNSVNSDNIIPTQNIQQTQAQIYSKEQQFTLNILEKLKQPVTNKLSLTIDIEIPYNINKLRESIDLLGLDKSTLIQYLLNDLNLNESIHKSISFAINNSIEKPHIETESEIKTEPVEIIQEVKNETNNQLIVKGEFVIEEEPEIIDEPEIDIVSEMEKINNRFSHITSKII